MDRSVSRLPVLPSFLSPLSSSLPPPSCCALPLPPSLILPPCFSTPTPLSLGLLFLPAPPCAPPPSSPAADIACKEKYVDNRTGRGETRWLVAGGSAPCGKCPNSPLGVVGDAISRPLFLHRPHSISQCNVGRHFSIHTLLQTGPRWISSSAGCNYSTA